MSSSGARLPWIAPLVAALVVSVAAALVYSGALAYFFSQDDYAGLARARGLVPRLDHPWRFVSGQLYFDVMGAIAGLEPRAYHLASLAAHAAAAFLVALWVQPRTSWWAATLAGVFFAAHPALYTALYSVSGIGEILALVFALASLLLARRSDRAAWLALPAFALSLLSKESTLLLPIVAWLDGGVSRAGEADRGSRRFPSPVVLGLAALAIVYLAIFLSGDRFGVRHALPAQSPYHLAFDATLIQNALTYAGWAANFLVPTVRGFTDAIDPRVHPYGIGLLIALGAGLFVPPLRRRGWPVGAVMFAVFLLPVLPLANHTYHYYLYAPLAGLAACVAGIFDAALFAWLRPHAAGGAQGHPPSAARRGPRSRSDRGAPVAASSSTAPLAWALTMLVCAALILNGATLVRKNENYPFLLPGLRADPTVDRAIISANVISDLRSTAPAPGTRLVFWSPIANVLATGAGQDTTRETYYESNVRSALMDGLAVRVFFPQVERVEFVRGYRPLAAGERYAIYRPDGRIRVVDERELQVLLSTLPRSGS